MREHTAVRAAVLALTLMGACDDPPQDKFMSQGGISPLPTAIVEGSVLYVGPRPRCEYVNGVAKRVVGRVILTMFEYDNPPPPEGSATTSTNLAVVSGSKLFQLSDCLAENAQPDFTERVLRSTPFSWARLTLYPGQSKDYQIRGFYDYDEDMNPFFSITRIPTGGDIVGAAVNDTSDPSKGFLRVTLPRLEDAKFGAIVSNVTVALGNPAWTERPVFRLSADRKLAADAPFFPLSADPAFVVRQFRGLTCPGGSGDGVSCGLSLVRLGGDEDARRLAAAGVGLNLGSSESYAFYTVPVDIRRVVVGGLDPMVADGLPDPHPFLGSLGVKWYQPMVLVQRLVPDPAQAARETAARIPRVLMIGSVLLDDVTKAPIKTSFAGTPVPISLPPVAAVELIAGRAECRVPYFAPGTTPLAINGRVAHCGELPTGHYTVNVLGGVAGGIVTTPAPGYPTTSESALAIGGGYRYSGQLWTVPNELGDAAQVGAENVIPDQSIEGAFVVHDPSEGEPRSCDASGALGQCQPGVLLVNPSGVDGADAYNCLPTDCCTAVEHLCGIRLCDKVDVPGVGRIASSPTTVSEEGVPDCIPFEMPAVCCP